MVRTYDLLTDLTSAICFIISQVIFLTNDLLQGRHIDSVNCWKVLRISDHILPDWIKGK